MEFSEDDKKWMLRALELAKEASHRGEVPVGAIVVQDGQILGEGSNQREREQNPVLHAEVVALQEAAKKLGSWRLSEATLFVTLEPCIMCAGALLQSRIGRVVFGTLDPKAGALGSLYKINEDARLNHRYLVQNGLLADECALLLKRFFQVRRGL